MNKNSTIIQCEWVGILGSCFSLSRWKKKEVLASLVDVSTNANNNT
jgi:hypothetical protein